MQPEEPPAPPRVHLTAGEASELGGELLRGPLRHPGPGAAQDGKIEVPIFQAPSCLLPWC